MIHIAAKPIISTWFFPFGLLQTTIGRITARGFAGVMIGGGSVGKLARRCREAISETLVDWTL